MDLTTHPVTPDRFDDFVAVVNPNRRDTHCWCLSHRLSAREVHDLGGGDREVAARALGRRGNPPGVVGYDDQGTPVGWCSIGPRADNTRLSSSKLITPIDDVPVWSIICVVVRGGHRRRGVTTPLIEGAVAYAADRGAPAVEAYPVDPGERRMDLTMAFVGTRRMFEKAGFEVVGETAAMASKMPRLVMRRVVTARHESDRTTKP
ncbi:GNAT family N-acetyltransferase [Nocardioides sp. 1609]|uniref:GNAT family N-acetyltransferase n=1 Tax=Nocardioides sp. 1609 TaxID=2508327 RepID=UPI00106F65C9|nr:GNAT family N-acetyltransferase [Nocardioides sp. 1609]